MRNSDTRRRSIFLLKTLGVAALYALLIFLDHRFFESGTVVSSFEPASGFALAVLLIGGRRYVWGVFLGAILINTTTAPLGAAAAISSCHALEVLCGAWLLTRDNKFDLAIRSLRDYLRLLLLGGIVGIGIGANAGVGALVASGFVTPRNFFHELTHWWTGDILGVILVTPLILVCWQTKNDWIGARRVAEAALLLGLTFIAGQIIFLGWFHTTEGLFQQIALGYWMFMLIVWVAVRLGTRGAVITLNITAVQALLGAYRGVGFFANDVAQTQLANYWLYTVTLSVVGMALATYFTERKLIEEALRASESRFRNLVETTSDWIWEIDENAAYTYASPKILSILGYEAAEIIGKRPFDLMPPDEAERVADIFCPIAAKRESLVNLVNANLHKDGHLVILETSGVPVIGPDGKFCGYRGIDRNITERKRAEEALHRSETKLRTLYESTSDAVMLLDEKGFFDCNRATLAIFGCATREEFCSKHPVDLSPPEQPCGADSMTLAKQRIATAMEKGNCQFEWMHRRADTGKDFFADVLLNSMELDGRAVLQATVRDITARKQNEAKIIRLSQAYRLLSQVNEAIAHAQNRNELFATLCNVALELGIFRFIWIGMLDGQKFSVIPVAYAGVEEGYAGKLNIRLDDERTGYGPTGRAIRGDTHVVCQDIENDPSMALWRDEAIKRGYRSSGVFPIHEAASVVGAINVYAPEAHFFTPDIIRLMRELAADISFALDVFAEKQRREQAEDEVRRINVELEHRVLERTHQLEAANKELEAFSYSVSHDLRAPLRSIDGFSRVLSKKYHGQFDATGQDWLERICRASQHMGRLIDDMLQLSLVARGPLYRELVDLSGIAEAVADDLRKAHPERQVRFILQHGLSAQADPGLLRIAMGNLLGNAFKFTGKKADAEIEFGACDRPFGLGEESSFFVRDNGDGFNMDYAHKLFGAFQRLHGENEFEGTGIGLATVQRIIHRHNGEVWAEAKKEQGATFYFTLPRTEQAGSRGNKN